MQGLKLCFNRCDIGIDQVIEQTGLLRIHLLAALGKLQTLELGDLVGQFLDQRLVAVDFLAHRVDLRQQLRCQSTQLVGGHLVEIGRRSHAPDFARAGASRR